MKTRIFVIALLAISTLFVTIQCSKEKNEQHLSSVDQIIQESDAMSAHILAFKERMEFYRENPTLKSGGENYSADSATLELESLINYDFGYTDVECNSRIFIESELIMPLNVLNRINDPELMQVYYDKVIDTIQAQMSRVSFSNRKLLLVDLEHTGYDSNGDAIIGVGSLIGNQNTLSFTPPPGWWFGFLGGTCLHTYIGVLDATIVYHDEIYGVQFPAPPPGKKYQKTHIITLDPIIPEDHFIVPVNQRDNLMDSKLFYANRQYGTITDAERCLTNYNERPFYIGHYDQFINDKEYEYSLDMTEFSINAYEEFYQTQHDRIWHELVIHLGHVWLVNTYVIQDIETY